MALLVFLQGPKGKPGKAGAPGRRGIQVSGTAAALPPASPHHHCPLEALTPFFCALRGCRGCQGLGVWWGDKALRVPLDRMGFLAGMAKQDSR